MSTPLTDRINLLTGQANAATGASDTTLSDAVGTLVAGYGGGGSALWKSVTVEENHNTGSVGNPIYWREFLGIPEQDILDGYIFFCEVLDNSGFPATAYYMSHGFYYTYNNEICCCFLRSGANSVISINTTYKVGYYQYVKAGTTINVYRFKEGNS